MKEQHLLRAHKLLFYGHIVTSAFMVFGSFTQLAMSDLAPYRSIIPIVATLIVAAGSIFFYITKKGSDFYGRYVGYGFFAVYFLEIFDRTYLEVYTEK